MSATIDGARFAEADARRAGDRKRGPGASAAHRMARQLGPSCAPTRRWPSAILQRVARGGGRPARLPAWRRRDRAHARAARAERLPDVPVLPLHGQVEPPAQRAAIRRDPEGRRRIVLATSIAETSITLDGVVGGGRRRPVARAPSSIVAAGTTHLITTRASRAAGRPARWPRRAAGAEASPTACGSRPRTPAARAFDPPEMPTADLAPLTLALAQWGVADPTSLSWLDPPPPAALWRRARAAGRLEALDGEGRITERGRKLAALPMAPWQAAMVLLRRRARRGRRSGEARAAAAGARAGRAGRGSWRNGLSRWNGDRSPRAQAARKLGARVGAAGRRRSRRTAQGGCATARACSSRWRSAGQPRAPPRRLGRDLALGRRARLSRSTRPRRSPRAEWLAIGDAQGRAQAARITAALPLHHRRRRALAGRADRAPLDPALDRRARRARLERRIGAIALASGPTRARLAGGCRICLVGKAVDKLGTLLPAEPARPRRASPGSRRSPRSGWRAEAGDWLRPLLEGRRDLDVPTGALAEALLSLPRLGRAPAARSRSPRASSPRPPGTHHAIDYAADGASERRGARPGAVRARAPSDDRRDPLLLQLTSPAGPPDPGDPRPARVLARLVGAT